MVSSYYEGKGFKKLQTVENIQFSIIPKGYNLYNKKITFISPPLYLSLTKNIIVQTPDQDINREKYLNHIIYKEKNADSFGKQNTSSSMSSFTDRVFSIFRRKKVRINSVTNGNPSG